MSEMIGWVAMCRNGVCGYITGSKVVRGEKVYTGVSLDGGKWQSKVPVVVLYGSQVEELVRIATEDVSHV